MTELTITAFAREAGVRPSTLRYYERIGLLPSAKRVAGRRRYDVCALKRLELISYALAQLSGSKGSRAGPSHC
jgi:MerR family redox-sensitive transcriptional activator SoxR